MSLFDVIKHNSAERLSVFTAGMFEELPVEVLAKWRSRIDHYAVDTAKSFCTDPKQKYISILDQAVDLQPADRHALRELEFDRISDCGLDSEGRAARGGFHAGDYTFHCYDAVMVLRTMFPHHAAFKAVKLIIARELCGTLYDCSQGKSNLTRAAIIMHNWLMEELEKYTGEVDVAV